MQKKEQSYQTKLQLAAALKEALQHKPMEKIHIRDLTDRCGIYRQTFYYHFSDIESLLFWAFQQDINWLSSLSGSDTSWQDNIEAFLQYTQKYRGFFLAVLDSSAYSEQQKSLQSQIVTLLSDALQRTNTQLLLPPQNYAPIFCSIMEQWIRGTLQQTPEEIVRFFTELMGESYLSHTNSLNAQACCG